MDVISVPGATLEYVDEGQGPPLVLLHGGTGNIAEWGDCVPYFAQRHRVVAYNRRGYGNSTPRVDFPPTYHHTDVADLLALLDALNVKAPVRLCGFSDGGTIVLMFAARFPGRVESLVSIAGHIYVEEKSRQGLRRARRFFESGIQKRGLDEGSHAVQGRRAWFDLWLDDRFGESFNIEHELDRIECPALIIQGTEDEYAQVSHARRIADGIADSRLYLIEGARHWIHGGEHADRLRQAVAAFLDEGESEGSMRPSESQALRSDSH